MKIRFLTGPKAGQTDHVENNSTTQTLINLGHIEIVTEAPPAPKPPTFSVVYGFKTGGASLQATCPNCGRTDFFVGPPTRERIAAGFLRYLCSHFKGVEVPDAVLAAYTQAWKPVPGLVGSAAPPSNTTERHVAEVDGVIVPVPKPSYWNSWEKVGPK